MDNPVIHVGDYVRNLTSGKFGYVAGISADNKRLNVLTIKTNLRYMGCQECGAY